MCLKKATPLAKYISEGFFLKRYYCKVNKNISKSGYFPVLATSKEEALKSLSALIAVKKIMKLTPHRSKTTKSGFKETMLNP